MPGGSARFRRRDRTSGDGGMLRFREPRRRCPAHAPPPANGLAVTRQQFDLTSPARATAATESEHPGSPLPASLGQYASLVDLLAVGHVVSDADVAFVDDAVQVWMRPGFDHFISPSRLHFEPLPHQLRAAASALRRMRGRAILADEVGLGKTIEALLVLSELRLRGLAEQVLLLVPAGLVGQWQEELDRKFGVEARVASTARDVAGEHPVLLASIASARRAPLRDAITAHRWDLVIVDEAHRARNPQSASGRLVRSLETRNLLLLTATPVENRLDDLFHLVNVVRPGHLGSVKEFRARHGSGSRADAVREARQLQTRMRDVMIRHRRSDVEVMLPARLAGTQMVTPSDDEAALYRQVSERVRLHARGDRPASHLSLQTVQRIAGSSPNALAPTLQRIGWDDLAAAAATIPVSAKAQVLRTLLRRHAESGEKVIVFTAFTQTLEHLAAMARGDGISVAVYHGSLTRRQKDDVIGAFERDASVLLSTEAGGEGRNLQFCHAMINFDLPWNPMQIEQRLGRIHRIGQTHDVTLTNLVTQGTIEERILRILTSKINLFELVVGELDMILGRIDDAGDFATRVFDAHAKSADDGELEIQLDALGETLAAARREYLASRARTDELVGELE